VLDAWLRERNGLPSIRGDRLSRDAIERLITKYIDVAKQTCPSLKGKKISPHKRHSAAMDLLQHGVDRTVIALWLGHESVETNQIYLHADMQSKEKALSRTTPLGIKAGRYRPDDKLLAFLESL
jgi:integrase/recombinase XerD